MRGFRTSNFPCTLHHIFFLFGYKLVCVCKIFSKPLFITCFAFRNVCLHHFRHIKITDQTIYEHFLKFAIFTTAGS